MVSQHNADIADTLHLGDVAMATTFWLCFPWTITSVVLQLATHCLILETVGFRGQAIR